MFVYLDNSSKAIQYNSCIHMINTSMTDHCENKWWRQGSIVDKHKFFLFQNGKVNISKTTLLFKIVLNIFTLPYIILASPTNSSLESIWEISKIPKSQNCLCENITITIQKTKLMVYITSGWGTKSTKDPSHGIMNLMQSYF